MGARDAISLDPAQLVRGILREYLAPPTIMRGAEWSQRYRRIVKGPEPGPWRNERTPYLVEPLNCMDPEDPVQKVVMQFATQLGKSEVLYNSTFKRIHLSPMDMMVVQPTLNDAKDHSRQRFAPTARAMPEVNAKLPDPRSRDETNTWQTKEIDHGVATLFWAGANSARSLASKPLGFVACDEVDGYPLDVDGEGDPLALIWERMSNFHNRKLLLCSTPTIKDFSRIEAEYLASDRRRYHVPCPHCGERQVLVWGAEVLYGIKWLKTPAGEPRPETAVYICQHCGAAMGEHHKTEMLANGIWVPDVPGAQRGLVAGFHLSKLYSPVGWKSWAMVVDDWIKAQTAARSGDVSKLKTFVNTSLAETWEEQGDRANEHELRKRAGEWPLRTVLWNMVVRTLGVDVQADRIEVYDWAWGRGMESQLVERLVFYGDPTTPEDELGPDGQKISPWAALTEYRRTPVLHVSGKVVPVLSTFVDTGYLTQAVYAYCRDHRHANVHATKGKKDLKSPIAKPTDQDVDWKGRVQKRGVKLWLVGTDILKASLHAALRRGQPGPGYVHLSKHYPDDVFEQLTAERLVTRYIKGHARSDWVKPAGKRNEGTDCSVYARAAAHQAGIDRWKDGDWAKWEGRVQVRDLFDQAPQATEQASPPPPPPAVHTHARPELGNRVPASAIARMGRFSKGAR